MSQPDTQPDKGPPCADLSGRQLGNFRLLRRLGRGAMAEVYLAEQAGLNRRVAVKILKPHLANDRVYLKRFEREAQAAASLVHANIVQIYEVGHVDGMHFIAQEYVEGQNLREWLARQGPPDLPHALSIMRQTAAALAKAAEHNIVHRDIKPENILLTRSGEVKVADFGLASFVREGEELNLTQVGMTLGTPLYMSPEQVEGRTLDSRSDLYSLGVTCYHMLAGQPPFTGETALSVAVQHLNKQPKPLSDSRPDLPAAVGDVLHKMLAKTLDQRYASATELLRDLRRLQAAHCGPWPEDLPGWDVSMPELPAATSADLTRQLDTLMKMAATPRAPGRRLGLAYAALLLGAFLGGGLLAWATAIHRPLLAASHASPGFPQQPTALRQWFYASRVGTEEAWQSILRYYPHDEYLVPRAKQRLAWLYLQQGNYAQATKYLEDLAKMGKGDERFRAFGLAGMCAVRSLEGRYNDSTALLDELWPIRDQLRDEQMRQMLNSTIDRNRQKVGVVTGPQWQQWLSEQFHAND